MKLLNEMYSGVGGLDNYDRAIDMINSAVEHHNLNDNFAAIADVEQLVQFLQGHHHDFTPALEQTVRDIIADEMDTAPEEQEEAPLRKAPKRIKRRGPGWPDNVEDEPIRYRKRNNRYKDTLVKAARAEEEESFSDKFDRLDKEKEAFWKEQDRRRQARKYAVHGRSRRSGGVRRRDLGKPRGTMGLEQEEEKFDWNNEVEKFRQRREANDRTDSKGFRSRLRDRRRATHTPSPFSVEQEEVTSLSDRRSRRDFDRADLRKLGKEMADGMTNPRQRRGHRHADPSHRQAQLMARKARPHVGLEQEEEDWKLSGEGKTRRAALRDTDWDKEVSDFQKRRKTVEPKYSRGRSKLRSRNRYGPGASSAFSVNFESFKNYHDSLEEMYRDSQDGLTIDLSGPDGNAFFLLGYARQLAKQLDWDASKIVNEMKGDDYNHLIETFDKYFGNVVTLINKPGEEDHEAE